MSRFCPRNPVVEVLIDEGRNPKYLYCTHDDIEYRDTSGLEFKIPKGFPLDFASIPWFLRWLIHPVDDHAYASLVHDFLYRTGMVKSRARADALFLDIMLDYAVPAWERVAMYYAVRLFGWRAWRDCRSRPPWQNVEPQLIAQVNQRGKPGSDTREEIA